VSRTLREQSVKGAAAAARIDRAESLRQGRRHVPTTLFTLGYEKRTVEEFVSLLLAAQIDVLVDVRETAWSHKPGFSKAAFSRHLVSAGIEYLHAPFVGNPKWLRSEASTHEECLAWYAWYLDSHAELVEYFDAVSAGLLRAGKRICITCFERHADDCHRSILAERWRQRGRRVVTHLATEGCERLL
jgi:uncharacterized protein (DUF488 family)